MGADDSFVCFFDEVRCFPDDGISYRCHAERSLCRGGRRLGAGQPLTWAVLSSQCWARSVSPSTLMLAAARSVRGSGRVRVSRSDGARPVSRHIGLLGSGLPRRPIEQQFDEPGAGVGVGGQALQGLPGAPDGAGGLRPLHLPRGGGEHREVVADERGCDVGVDRPAGPPPRWLRQSRGRPPR